MSLVTQEDKPASHYPSAFCQRAWPPTNSEAVRKIQLKSRLTFCEKYRGKGIYVAFRSGRDWYLYPHDEMLEKVEKIVKFKHTSSWVNDGIQSFAKLTKPLFQILNPYQIEPSRNLQRKLELDDKS